MQSEEWGPYRIEERLGSGGMGEVYRAYDSRLDRWVALKIIRPEVMAGRKARERFRREARSAAGLSHPTVLQIYDIIEREEGDGIVMELVEGETLGRILKRQGMELDRVVRLAREIAEGLAAAHHREIIHRDLKADNVMITPEDHPKILDFGLAKRLGLTEDQSISIEGRVVGTSHAMSPEQAQGFEVDHRTDLFSFGTLLYEMVTGTSPFRRPALAETLTRVCVHRQTPAKDLRPEMPAELSDLIDSLLQKKPEDRPQDSREVVLALRQMEPAVSATINPISYPTMVDMPRTTTGSMVSIPATGSAGDGSVTRTLPAGESSATWWYRTATFVRQPVAWLSALAVIAVAAGSLFLVGPSPPSSITVAVIQPEVVAAGQVADLDLVRSALHVAALQSILDLDSVHPLAPDRVEEVTGTSEEIAVATAADEVVTSRLRCQDVRCRVTVSRVAANGNLLDTESFDVLTDDFLLMSTTMADRVSRIYGEYRPRSDGRRLTVRSEDYVEFLRVREIFLRRPEEATLDQLLVRIETVETTSPRFTPAYLLEADMARSQFLTSRDPADLERALAAIEQVRTIAPDDPQALYDLATVALDSERLEVAEEAIEELERLQPGEPRLQALRALVLERRGNPEEAIELMGSAVRQRPSVQNLFDLANMEIRLGKNDAARGHLRELLTRFPDSFGARKLLAQIELQSGRAEAAAQLYEDLVRSAPEPDLLANLGVAYLLLERDEDAAETFRVVRDRQPQNPFATFNLADTLLQLQREEEAHELYRRVIELIDQDPAGAENWQFLTMKAQAYAHLGEVRQAVSLVQQALRLAPDNTQVSYAAAVVFSVVGDTATALVYVERALEQSFDPRWFRFTWFDELRHLPDFQAVMDDVED